MTGNLAKLPALSRDQSACSRLEAGRFIVTQLKGQRIMIPFWLETYNLLIFNQLDSTSSEALRLAKTCPAGNFIILASTQTHGRGRQSRRWQSLSGNLHASILLKHQIAAERQPQLSLVAGVALYQTIEFLASQAQIQLDLKLKWPNDLLINHHKVGGILLESVRYGVSNYLVIGIGLNIIANPQDIDRLTTNLLSCGVSGDNPLNLLAVLMNYFERCLQSWQRCGLLKLRATWLKNAYNLKKLIIIDDGKALVSGIFEDIDENGALRIKTSSGVIYTVTAGEMTNIAVTTEVDKNY